MTKSIEDLKHEHQAILSALRILDQMAANIVRGSMPDGHDLREFLDFLKEFADKCHHGKEEAMLFPALAEAGMPKEGGPIDVMLAEHDQGRNYVREMVRAIDAGPDYRAFSAAARQYSSLLRTHIEKEETVLFPMAEKVLDGARLERLYEAFQEHEEKVIGHGRHEALHETLKRLKTRYIG